MNLSQDSRQLGNVRLQTMSSVVKYFSGKKLRVVSSTDNDVLPEEAFGETTSAAVTKNFSSVTVKTRKIKRREKALVLLEWLNFEHLASALRRLKASTYL